MRPGTSSGSVLGTVVPVPPTVDGVLVVVVVLVIEPSSSMVGGAGSDESTAPSRVTGFDDGNRAFRASFNVARATVLPLKTTITNLTWGTRWLPATDT